jgi:endonuclease I/V8-like Glu-specific endopeptidase
MNIPNLVMSAAERRYVERQPSREATLQKLNAGSILAANTAEQVSHRLKRLAFSQTAVETLAAPAPVGASGVALERIIGQSDLVGIMYLEMALAVGRSVGRIHIRSATGRVEGFGTGFLVSPRLLATNNHVLSEPRQASSSRVEFNFQDGVDGKPLTSVFFDLDPATLFLTDPELDYTLVAVRETARSGESIRDFGYSRLIEEKGKVLVGEFVNIIQHPNGEPKQLALRENRVIDMLEHFVHYETDTAPGSSGSPVFNDQWEVVALHHSGVPRRDGETILTRDGTAWTPEMGEHRIDWIANEGARVSSLIQHVRQRNLTRAERELCRAVLELSAIAPLATAPVAAGRRTERSSTDHEPIVTSDGDTTIWIPVRVSVKVGSATPAPTAHEPAGLREALAALEAGRSQTYYDAEKDARDRQTYYGDLPSSLDPRALYERLSQILRSSHKTKPSYNPSVQVYPWVDLRPDRKLSSIYSMTQFDPEDLIREDFRIERERAARFHERLGSETTVGGLARELDLLEASMPFNCEHVVPQSWFGKREPMRGDLHHLFACEPSCNSFRSNIPYFDFADFGETVRGDCGKRAENRFEPARGKGCVARATLYFLLRYPGEINRTANEMPEDRLGVLIAWHKGDAVGEYERHRNQAIFEKQGNRNPLIDFPNWADRIDFRLGLG